MIDWLNTALHDPTPITRGDMRVFMIICGVWVLSVITMKFLMQRAARDRRTQEQKRRDEWLAKHPQPTRETEK